MLKRKGISVIEVLIVIIVISILAAMLFFSSTEAVMTARATAIINNLSKMKSAINLWYMDNRDRFYYTDNGYFIALSRKDDGTWDKSKGKVEAGKLHNYFYNHRDEIAAYFDSSGVNFNDYKEGDADWTLGARDRYYASTGNYAVYFGYGNRKIYVVAKVSDRNSGSEAVLRQKLKARAKSAGLLWYDFKVSGADDKLDNKHGEYNGEYANVLMEAVDLSPWSAN